MRKRYRQTTIDSLIREGWSDEDIDTLIEDEEEVEELIEEDEIYFAEFLEEHMEPA